MKYAHLLKLTVFSHENEDSESILDAFLSFFPFNLEDNKISMKKTNASGFSETKIEIFEIILTKNNLINQFLDNLLDKLDENQKETILRQVESRLDNNLDLFLRFDKDSWIKDKKLLLTDSGKCFHLKMSVAAFPKKREVALNVIKELLSK
ncbi:hypothetical protein CMO83_00320 [Candidatus Woesearchaeota archaeon]|jgi:hypothetical protein|nr:hypothetical protein [Candidatus Woesearchaeota archaeon]MDP6648029.1 RNA-binding domain-containing protein [Candidatus Woesearchaeota archaeon]|tara:strand:+ start:43648 stop:44100 length:453 start_codon:yes stop_codon:yes gene_type:complete